MMEEDDEDVIYLGSFILTTSKQSKVNIQLGFKLCIKFIEIEIELQEAFYETRVFYNKEILLISWGFMKFWEKEGEI